MNYNTRRKYHEDGTTPDPTDPNTCFVFGSNLKGVHGAGAAKEARLRFGARVGFSQGLVGRSYAIPTKDKNLKPLSLRNNPVHQETIAKCVHRFNLFTHTEPSRNFFITRVGCGLAGYKDYEIAPFFLGANIDNCSFPEPWREILEDCSFEDQMFEQYQILKATVENLLELV